MKGIGEKGAQKLLAEYGTLDAILAAAEKIEPKRAREALLANADNARLSRELVSIQLDVPVSIGVQELRPGPSDQAALTQLLTELEFFSLVKKLVGDRAVADSPLVPVPAASPADEAARAPVPAVPRPEVLVPSSNHAVPVIDDPGLLPGIVARLRDAPLAALHTETNARSPRGAELIGLSLAASPTEVWYFPFGHRPLGGELAAPAPVKNLPPLSDPACLPLVALLTDPGVPKAGHQVKFDWQVLRSAGVELAGVSLGLHARRLPDRLGKALLRHRRAVAGVPGPHDADLRGRRREEARVRSPFRRSR